MLNKIECVKAYMSDDLLLSQVCNFYKAQAAKCLHSSLFFAYINLPILINKEKTIKDEDEISNT